MLAACHWLPTPVHLGCSLPAELSNKPAVVSATGYADKVVLKVLRPETLADTTALSYKVCTHPTGRLACCDRQGAWYSPAIATGPSPCHASYVAKGMHGAWLPRHDT